MRWGRESVAAAIAILSGVALRIWQYAANPSIWVDEGALAHIVLERSPVELFGRLDGQLAPPGFLLAVKLAVTLFGISEYALRLVPLILGVASPLLFFLVARAVLRPVSAIVATFLFSIATPLVFFSSNLKQYSSDVAIALLVIVIAMRILRTPLTMRSACGFAGIGIALLFFSQAAVFPVTIAGAVILVRRGDRRYRILITVVWAAAVLVTSIHASSVLNAVDNAYMRRFWSHAFMPRDGIVQWLRMTIENIFGGPPGPWAFDGLLHYKWPGLFVILVLIGSVALCVKARANGVLVVGPILLALAASAAGAYPFGTRVSLFLLPLLLLTAVGAAEAIPRKRSDYASLLLVPIAILALQLPPRTPEHLRPVLQHMSDRWKPGDALWVYYGAGQAFQYYKKRFPLEGEVRVGSCDRADPREYLRQVDAERGRPRVWILMAHGSGPYFFDERGLLLRYLDTIGRRLDEVKAPHDDSSRNHAAVYLFDLSDPAKLATTSADRFPIENDYAPQRWTCYGTMSPFGADERVIAAVLDPTE